MPHIHQKTQHCGLNIYRVDQCHQISEEIERNKSSLPILGPSENTLPPVVLCYCSYSGHNPHSGQKVRWTELLKFAAKIKKGDCYLEEVTDVTASYDCSCSKKRHTNAFKAPAFL